MRNYLYLAILFCATSCSFKKVTKITSRENLDIADISVENYHDVDDFGRTLKSKILADLQEVKNS